MSIKLPKYIERIDDSELLKKNKNGTYSFVNSNMSTPHEYSYETLITDNIGNFRPTTLKVKHLPKGIDLSKVPVKVPKGIDIIGWIGGYNPTVYISGTVWGAVTVKEKPDSKKSFPILDKTNVQDWEVVERKINKEGYDLFSAKRDVQKPSRKKIN